MDGKAKIRRKSPCRITVRGDRLALSRTAAENLPEYVDLYEYGNLLAIKGDLEGKIRLSIGSHRYRQNIRTGKIVEFVREKYGCRPGDVLSAWYRDGVLMFCREATPEEAQAGFDERFSQALLDVKAPEKYSLRIRGRTVTLSGAAGVLCEDRLTVYECGDVFALKPDEEGLLWTVPYSRSGSKAIHSEELANFIKQKYGPDHAVLHGWEKDGVVFFSNRREAIRKPLSSGEYVKHSFEMSKETITVNILQNSRLLVSELGAAVLDKHITLCECGRILALVSDPDGEFKMVRCAEHSGCDITGRDLVRYIKEKLNLGDEPNCLLNAQMRGNVVYFSGGKIEYLPPFRKFERVNFGRVCEMSVISLSVNKSGTGRFYISRTARGALGGALSLFRRGDVWAFAQEPDGSLCMSASGHISCKGLREIAGMSELGPRQQFYVREQGGAVFFSRRRFKEGEELNLNRFECLTSRRVEALAMLPAVIRGQAGITATIGAAMERQMALD